jgi:hypothetical protein
MLTIDILPLISTFVIADLVSGSKMTVRKTEIPVQTLL